MNRDFAAMNADPAAREDFVRRCLTCIDEACEAAAEDLVRLRRDLHRHPETAWAEYRTAALAAQELAARIY